MPAVAVVPLCSAAFEVSQRMKDFMSMVAMFKKPITAALVNGYQPSDWLKDILTEAGASTRVFAPSKPNQTQKLINSLKAFHYLGRTSMECKINEFVIKPNPLPFPTNDQPIILT